MVVNWDAISSIAEVFGVLVVALSLVYLATQIKQSNTQARGEAHSNWLTTWNENIKGLAADRETVEILQRGFDDFSTLPKVEQAIFAQQIAALINHWHLAADLAENELISKQLYEGATEVILSVCATSGGSQYLESNHAGFPRGSQLLELSRSGYGTLPPFDILSPWWSIESSREGN